PPSNSSRPSRSPASASVHSGPGQRRTDGERRGASGEERLTAGRTSIVTGWRGWGQLKQFKEIGSQTYLRADVERQRLFGALANRITLKTPMVSARNGNKRRQ